MNGGQDYRYGNSFAGIGQHITCDASPVGGPPIPRFEQIAEGYANIPSDLHKAVMRLRSLADRYGGAQPEAVIKEGIKGEPSSLASRMEANVDAIRGLVLQLHGQIDRLERF